MLLFVGGPLDGRVEIRAARHGDPLPTVTHVHLHDGPKVVHRYDLEPLIEGVGIYNLRPPVRRQVRDDSAPTDDGFSYGAVDFLMVLGRHFPA